MDEVLVDGLDQDSNRVSHRPPWHYKEALDWTHLLHGIRLFMWVQCPVFSALLPCCGKLILQSTGILEVFGI